MPKYRVWRDKGWSPGGPTELPPRYGFGETFESSEDFARLGAEQGYLEVIEEDPKPKREKKSVPPPDPEPAQ